MKYLVLIGDMVDSRLLKNRGEIQERFTRSCQRINKRRSHYAVVSPLMITLGDEFQCVLKSADQLWSLIARLELDMHPCQFRFSVGVGEISTQLNAKSSLGMDGPAFYHAREGIELLRKQGGLYLVNGITTSQKLVQHSLHLWSAARQKWNLNRLTTFARLMEGLPVPEIARELKVTEQAVYRTRRDGELDTVMALLTEISGVIEQELKK